MSSIIAVSGLRKHYGRFEAVKGIDFQVEAGSLFAFLGQNGAGKSTTINVLLGLLRADAGEVDYGAFGGYAGFRQQIGVVFQDNVFDTQLTVAENLLLYGQLYLNDAAAARQRCREVCAQLTLDAFAHQRFGQLSGGQKRKAELGRALFNTPRLLFLDEPTTGLDPKTRAEVWDTLHRLRRETGMTIFLTTHYMAETAEADSVFILHRGERVCQGSPAELKARYSHDRLAITPHDPDALARTLAARGFSYQQITDTYHIPVRDTAQSIDLLCALRENVRYYEALRGSMDDVFLNAVGEELGGDR